MPSLYSNNYDIFFDFICSIINNIFMSTISAEDASIINLREDNQWNNEEPSDKKYNSTAIQSKQEDANPQRLETNKSQIIEPKQQQQQTQQIQQNHEEQKQPSMGSKKKSSHLLLKQKDRFDNKQIQKNMLNHLDQSHDQLKIITTESQQKLQTKSLLNNQKRKPAKLAPLSQVLKRQNVQVYDDKYNSASQVKVSPKKRRVRVIKAHEIQNNHKFIQEPIPKNKKLAGVLKRDKSGLKKLFPQYDLFLNEELKFIMSSKRKPCFCTSTYHMSSKIQSVDQLETEYVGTVYSNFTGSLWNIEDTTLDPNNRLLATISYDNQITCSYTPRNLQIYIVSPYYNYSDIAGVNFKKNLKDLYQIGENKQNKRILKFTNKKPEWSEEHNIWVMNFHGKALISSVKNMILVDAQNEKKQVLLIAKAGDHAFNFQICFPLSPRIAMAIANTSFDFKWVCQ